VTRRDLELVATTIRTLPLAIERRGMVAVCFANSIAAQMSSFDRWKFYSAAGVADHIKSTTETNNDKA